MLPGETIHSFLPQDLPWWQPDYFVFFSVLYLVLLGILAGMGYCLVKATMETIRGNPHGHR